MKDMKTKELTPTRVKRLRVQGYTHQSEEWLAEQASGHRFAFKTCVFMLAIAVATANIPLLMAIMVVEFLGIVTPRHPFDHLYNYLVRHITGGPKLPKRDGRLKFACTLAFTFTGATMLLFQFDQMLVGYIVGSTLISVAVLVAFLDFCIPSIIYNALFLSYKRAEPLELKPN
jgi:hypothetical protein